MTRSLNWRTRSQVCWCALLLIGMMCSPDRARAQAGDGNDKEQPEPMSPEAIPPAPVLSPEQALESFTVQPGFRIELVAAEPLVTDPVAMTFDERGRIWVAEMRGYMPDVDGTNEDAPIGRIVVLTDTDGDGRMDESRVFLDELVLPRALMLVRDGLLVITPPDLIFCRDTDGDGVADEKVKIEGNFQGIRSPEHASNGLLWGIDNRIHLANDSRTFGLEGDGFVTERGVGQGQWGLAQDDAGRLFFNNNSVYLMAHSMQPQWLQRNAHLGNAYGGGMRTDHDQTTWPGRVNPGVNRAYRKGTLRDDGTLRHFTAACGPVIYRGDQFPSAILGDAFICEPGGNFIRRAIITDADGVLKSKNAYENTEFLTSTDERFRPVNLYNGPDGCLYVVDMYQGLLQHRVFLTTYLRQQTLARQLDRPLHMGRIYRIVHEDGAKPTRPNVDVNDPAALLALLSHPNGWWRTRAQQRLVELGDSAAVQPLVDLVSEGDAPRGRLHALWTLAGMGKLQVEDLLVALADEDVDVREAALQLSEPMLRVKPIDDYALSQWNDLIGAAAALAEDASVRVRWRLALVMSGIAQREAAETLVTLLLRDGERQSVREAALTGLQGRELELLQRIAADERFAAKADGHAAVFRDLARCVTREGEAARFARLLDVAASEATPNWQRQAILDGAAAAAKQRKGEPMHYAAQPAAMASLAASDDANVRKRMTEIEAIVAFGGAYVPPPPPTPLDEAQQRRFTAGELLFAQSCASCHGSGGLGIEGQAPPLLDSPWVLESPKRAASIALLGVSGPIEVHGRVYDLEMPGHAAMQDEEIASILTYIRRAWGHRATPIDPETIAAVRRELADRTRAFTAEELLKIE